MIDPGLSPHELVSLTKPKGRGSKLVRWMVLGGAVLLLLVGSFAWWGWGLFTEQARTALSQNPVIQAHIGEIREMHLNREATGDAEGRNVFVYDLVGTTGRGTATTEFITVNADTERIASGVLRMSDSTEFPLVPSP